VTPALIANVVLAGVLTGCVYALMALGLSVVFGVVRIVNFAHGEMMAGAMFAAVFLYQAAGLDPLLAMPFIAGGSFVLGYLMQRHLLQSLIGRPEDEQFVLLLAIAIFLSNGFLLAFGPEARGVLTSYSFDSYALGPLVVDKTKALAAVAAALIAGGLLWFFRHSLTGKAIRACADNLTGAEVVGLNVRQLYAITFGIGAACVGAAGALLSIVIDVTPMMGPELTLLSFIIVIIGGLGSMEGALLGGILIGVSEAVAGGGVAPAR
jgi:branched-chain amino acid transport system permease protein